MYTNNIQYDNIEKKKAQWLQTPTALEKACESFYTCTISININH